jgi:hypothetical protein
VGGYELVALIFAREVNDSLTSLVKTIDKQLNDASVGRNGHDRLGVFVVFCGDDPNLRQQLESMVAREGLKQVVLSTHDSAGPAKYRVAREAELTAVIYDNHSRVASNFAFENGDLEPESAQAILQALTRVLPRK